MTARWLAVAVVIAACGRAGQTSSSNPAPDPVADPPPARTVACADSGDSARPTVLCGLCRKAGGEPILRVMPADLVVVPEGAQVLATAEASSARDLEYTIALSGDRLIAQVFWCPGCRRQIGWGFAVDVAALRGLDGAHRRELQRALGFAETPFLDTAAAWGEAAPVAAPATRPNFPACRAAP